MNKTRVYLDQNMSEGEVVRLGSGHVAVFSARCPDSSSANQDSAAVVPIDSSRAVLVVADGMGGGRAGEQASQLAVSTLVKVLESGLHSEVPLRALILDGFEKANRAVLELGVGAATTLAVLEIQGLIIRPYHVGDSMIIAVGQRGKLKLQTVPHSPVGYAVEAGYLEEQEAIEHEERHIVSNVLGSSDMHIALGPELKLSAHDTVLLSSDGLFDNLHTTEIIELSRKGPLSDVIGGLADRALLRMKSPDQELPSKPDDVTIITFRPAVLPEKDSG